MRFFFNCYYFNTIVNPSTYLLKQLYTVVVLITPLNHNHVLIYGHYPIPKQNILIMWNERLLSCD